MIWVVAHKELLDHLRDARSLLGSLLLVVLGPFALWGVSQLLDTLTEDKPLQLPVVGAEYAPGLVEHLRREGVEVGPAPSDPDAVVTSGEAQAVLVVSPDYATSFRASRPARVDLLVDRSRNETQRSARRIQALLHGYAQRAAVLRLMTRGVAPAVSRPLAIETVDLATPAKRGANVLNVIPLFLMLSAFVGGMNLAIDGTAGERERGSLEPLLLSAASRQHIVLGKWVATTVASASIVALTTLAFVLASLLIDLHKLHITVLLGPSQVGLILAALLPLAAFGSALQMLVATFARTFKEAQTYLNLLNLVPTLPAIFLIMKPAAPAAWMMLVPMLSQLEVVVAALRGETVPPLHFALLWLSCAACTAACLTCLAHLFRRERIIFGRS